MNQLPFNLYDVFGFLIPGLVLCGVLLWPVGRVDTSVGGALLTVVAAYVVGLLLHEVTRPWVQSRVGGRLPSDFLLDEGQLSGAVREAYVRKVQARFELDAGPAGAERDAAFQLARTAVASAGRGRYAEQMQSMRALCRGLVGALALGAAWGFGLALGGLPIVAALLLVAGLFFAGRALGWFDRLYDADRPLGLPAAALVLAVAGIVLSPLTPLQAASAALLGAVAVALAWVAWAAHDRYANASAEEVIRGFVLLDDVRKE